MNDPGQSVWTALQEPVERQRILDDVFADPAYDRYLESREADLKWVENLLELAKEAVMWLDRVGTRLSNLSTTQPIFFWLIMIGLSAILALLLWHIGYSVSRAFRRTAPKAPGAVSSEEERPARVRALVEQAESLARDGVYAEALRFLLLALVAHTQETNTRLLAGWTNLELVRQVRIHPDFHEPLNRFVQTVDHVWYGRNQATLDDYGRSAAFVEAYLKGQAGTPRRGPDG